MVQAHPDVTSVELVGSRARGTENPFSDWDFAVDTSSFGAVAAALPALVAGLQPLAGLWDPLSPAQCYMLTLRGPRKVDLIFDEPHEPERPREVGPGTLGAIDEHFWDWTLWLTAKLAAKRTELVETELRKMLEHILAPLGVAARPASLAAAVESYRAARARAEARFGVSVPRELEQEVAPVVCRAST